MLGQCFYSHREPSSIVRTPSSVVFMPVRFTPPLAVYSVAAQRLYNISARHVVSICVNLLVNSFLFDWSHVLSKDFSPKKNPQSKKFKLKISPKFSIKHVPVENFTFPRSRVSSKLLESWKLKELIPINPNNQFE